MFYLFFKERNLFFCSLENAFLGQMFFIFRKYYILIHKAMISWPIMLTLSPPQSHPVPDFTIAILKWSEVYILQMEQVYFPNFFFAHATM